MNPIESFSKKLSDLVNINESQIQSMIQSSLQDNDLFGYIHFYKNTDDSFLKDHLLSILLNEEKKFLEKEISKIFKGNYDVKTFDYAELDDSYDIIRLGVKVTFYIGNVEAKTLIIKNEIEASIEGVKDDTDIT